MRWGSLNCVCCGGFGPLDIQLYQHSLLKSLFSSLNCLCAFLNWQIRRSVCPLILLSTLIPMSNCFDYRIFTSLEGGRCTSDNSSFSTLFLLLFNWIFNCISTCYYKLLWALVFFHFSLYLLRKFMYVIMCIMCVIMCMWYVNVIVMFPECVSLNET